MVGFFFSPFLSSLLSYLHHPVRLFFLLCLLSSPLISHLVHSSLSMSESGDFELELELDLDDLTEDVHKGASNMSHLNPATSLLSSSSAISHPSGLPIVKISRLTHDELRHNPEFMRYVHMVIALQELLDLQDKTLKGELPYSMFIFHHLSFFVWVFFSVPAATISSMAVSSDCSSLHPSELASQVSSTIKLFSNATLLLPYPRPTTCPGCYPSSILWTLANCKADSSVGTSSTNMSQLSCAPSAESDLDLVVALSELGLTGRSGGSGYRCPQGAWHLGREREVLLVRLSHKGSQRLV